MIDVVRLSLAAAAVMTCTASSRAQQPGPRAEDKRPNVIVVLADDLGYADVGAQGCKDIPTPNIDSIAARGVRFTAGYVQPWCAPARHSLLTACWPGRAKTPIGKRTTPDSLVALFEKW